MLLDKIFREFFGFILIFFAIFLTFSLFNYNAPETIFPGQLGHIISTSFLQSFGYGSLYLCLLIFLLGCACVLTNISDSTSTFTTANRFILAFIAIFPMSAVLTNLTLFDFLELASSGLSYGGLAGENIRSLTSVFINEPWYSIKIGRAHV